MPKKFLVIFSSLLVIASMTAAFWLYFGIEFTKNDKVGRLDVQSIVDLGSVLNGTAVPAPIKITNRSRRTLTVNNFNPDCSCIKVYTQQSGVKQNIDELVVAPNSSEMVYADLRVSGEPGIQLASSIGFHDLEEDTNYQLKILFTPVVRFYTLPRVAVFGDTNAGTPVTKRIELRTDGTYKQPLKDLGLRSSSMFKMQFLPAPDSEKIRVAKSLNGQQLIGYADLTFDSADQPISVNETLTLFNNAGEDLCQIVASATALGEFQLTPSKIVLPKSVSGKASFSSFVFCRSRSGESFTVIPDSIPENFRVTLDEETSDPRTIRKITVDYIGPILEPNQSPTRHSLTFKIVRSKGEQKLSLDVVIAPEK